MGKKGVCSTQEHFAVRLAFAAFPPSARLGNCQSLQRVLTELAGTHVSVEVLRKHAKPTLKGRSASSDYQQQLPKTPH